MKKYSAAIVMLVLFCLAASAQAADLKEGFALRSVSDVGKVIELTDGSVWKVENPSDWPIAYNWLPGQKIGIRGEGELVNLQRGEWVDATMTTPPGQAPPPEGSGTPTAAAVRAPARPDQALVNKLDQILKRLEAVEARVQVMDWRLRQLEREVPTGPRPNAKP